MSMYSLDTQYRLLVGSPDQPQRPKLRCIRKKISLALPIARPRQVVESDCALCWPEVCKLAALPNRARNAGQQA
ncbi:uncharacterized protein TrAtP1_006373 [Trichoderma atroviride]|uniref:uncharacterized protein n=1 Tax=Hypocrea atroviridis TaxID=63577 RepID=UPI00331CA951|nr:hypothetical protein TrAtP1_006373 [Trichoderma atroviride]